MLDTNNRQSMASMNNRLALAILNRKKRRNVINQGFTLVELMIVIVIVGILSSVALPNFMASRDKASAGAVIGSMSSFAKACGANMAAGDGTDLGEDVAVITQTNECDGSKEVTFKNKVAFVKANITGVKCGGTANTGTGEYCTLTVNMTTGSVTGAWS